MSINSKTLCDLPVNFDDEIEARHAMTDIPIRGGAALRKKLKWTNSSYHLAHPAHTSDPKGYYLYGVLNEVEKTGLSMMQAYEFIRESEAAGIPNNADDDAQRIADNIIQSRIDEMALWQRKLTEIMIDLQGFSLANKVEYYSHFLLVHELKSLKRTQDDLLEFYNAVNNNYAHQEHELKKQIDAIVPKLECNKCWYAEVTNAGHITNRIQNFDKRFQYSFQKMKPYLRATLRTRNLSFGNQSKSLHAVTSSGERQLSLDSLDAHAGRVANLSLHVIVLIKDLMHLQNTKGWLKTCSDLVKKNDYPIREHRNSTRPDIEKGDFVLACGDIAQVIKVQISKDSRYKSFCVRYLAESPLPDISIDVFPADLVRIVYKRAPLVAATREMLKNLNPDKPATTREINSLMTEGLINGWNNGLRDVTLNPSPENIAKFQKYKLGLKTRYDDFATSGLGKERS